MTQRELEQAAEFLAGRAIVLLGVGIAAALLSLAAALLIVAVLRRHRDTLRGMIVALVRRLRRIPRIDRAVERAGALVPSAYLVVHLALGLILTAAAAVFVVIAENAIGGGTVAAFDVAFARALRRATSAQWEQVFAVVSWLGEREVLAVASAILAVVLFIRYDVVMAGGWIAAQGGGALLNAILKQTYARIRPEFADPTLAASSWSFPSGHAMGTFVLCGVACYLFFREARWPTAAVAVGVALAWCLVMSFSRLYLGEHYVSDVVAGIIAGTAWVAVCASAFEVIWRRRRAR